ncbi:MAG: DUF2924 domain-containing protein [Armatimonadota bacterium]|nr:DUF2924 domain-containing protein [bacterium]
MKDSVLKQIADLQSLSYNELKERWAVLYGDAPPAYNRTFIIKRLAYRIQELAYGGLSKNAKAMMRDVLDANGFNEKASDGGKRRRERKQKEGMPVAGTRLTREWNGKRCEVIVVSDGFEFEGRPYKSLSAITRAITGTNWNGPAFFGLRNNKVKGSKVG